MKQAFLAFLLFISCLLVAHGHEGRPFYGNARGRIPTNFCEVTTLSDLLELQTKVDYERIGCEAGQFSTADCSRYWMLHRDLVRKKLSYKACQDQHSFYFHNWAGTSAANGTFQDEYFATLALENTVFTQLEALLAQQHTDKMALLLDGTTTTRSQLVALENANAASERSLTYTEAAHERANDHSEEQTTRDLVSLDGQQMRAAVSSEGAQMRVDGQNDGQSSRANVSAELTATRNLMSFEQQVARSNISFEQLTTRNLESQEETDIRSLESQESEDIRALTTQEESSTRAFDTAQETSTRDDDESEEQTTRDDVDFLEQTARTLDQTEENNTRSDNLAQETSTRADDAQESQNTRDFDSQREQEIRALDTQSESATRALDSQEELTARNLVNAQHNETRDLFSASATQVRTEKDTQEAQTVAAWHSASQAAEQTIIATSAQNRDTVIQVVHNEAAATRNLVQSTEATNVQDHHEQAQTTRDTIVTPNVNGTSVTDQSQNTDHFIDQSTEATQQILSNANSNTQATWNMGAGNVMAALASFSLGIPTTLFTQLGLHFDLMITHQQNPIPGFGGPAASDLFSSGSQFDLLRATVNSTLNYNARYGSNSNSRTANTYWSTAESYRTQQVPDLRKAAIYYSHAYAYAITPTSSSN